MPALRAMALLLVLAVCLGGKTGDMAFGAQHAAPAGMDHAAPGYTTAPSALHPFPPVEGLVPPQPARPVQAAKQRLAMQALFASATHRLVCSAIARHSGTGVQRYLALRQRAVLYPFHGFW